MPALEFDANDHLNRLAVDTVCPKCDVEPGYWCIRVHRDGSGETTTAYLHKARTEPILSAYRLGLDRGSARVLEQWLAAYRKQFPVPPVNKLLQVTLDDSPPEPLNVPLNDTQPPAYPIPDDWDDAAATPDEDGSNE